MTVSRIDVEAAFSRLFIAAADASLRKEDRQKVDELVGILPLIATIARRGVLLDAAAGKGSVGIVAAALLNLPRVVVLERNHAHAELARRAVQRLSTDQQRAAVEVRQGDIHDLSVWPTDVTSVVALHACGPASDAVIDGCIAKRVKHLVLVPCCYADSVPFASTARAMATQFGTPRHAAVLGELTTALIDTERTLRLEAAGFETTVASFVAPTVTPHHLAWRARWSGESKRMADAAERLSRLR